MLLELLGVEETIRSRQSMIARDVHAYDIPVQAGFLRRLFGGMLVRVGESIRGSSQTTPLVVATSR